MCVCLGSDGRMHVPKYTVQPRMLSTFDVVAGRPTMPNQIDLCFSTKLHLPLQISPACIRTSSDTNHPAIFAGLPAGERNTGNQTSRPSTSAVSPAVPRRSFPG